ncbi:MAG: hypothetical protein WC753_02715 [Candidatus Gracilibacteria bacterium]
MKNLVSNKLLRKLNITTALGLVVLTAGVTSTGLFASATSNFAQTINAGTLSVDIVNSSYVTVGSPSVTMTAAPFSFSCQTATGTFGAAEQLIYVKNPDASDTGWAVSLAASAPTAVWDGAASDYDFNDPGTAGCVDDGATTDADAFSGQMTVDPSGGTLATGSCATCGTTSVTKGSSNAFVQGSVDSVTVVSGAAGSDDIGDWKLSGVAISQKIPAEQAAASDYDINMTLSVVAV